MMVMMTVKFWTILVLVMVTMNPWSSGGSIAVAGDGDDGDDDSEVFHDSCVRW